MDTLQTHSRSIESVLVGMMRNFSFGCGNVTSMLILETSDSDIRKPLRPIWLWNTFSLCWDKWPYNSWCRTMSATLTWIGNEEICCLWFEDLFYRTMSSSNCDFHTCKFFILLCNDDSKSAAAKIAAAHNAFIGLPSDTALSDDLRHRNQVQVSRYTCPSILFLRHE